MRTLLTDDEKRAALREGRPLYFSGDASDSTEIKATRKIQASWLEELAKTPDRCVEVPVDISNAIIEGPLRLSYTTFKCGLSITDSDFIDEVDFSFAEFKQLASFERTYFHKKANFRAAHAECDFEINNASFLTAVAFTDLFVNEILSANGAFFVKADFERAEIGKSCFFQSDSKGNLVRFCDEAIFRFAHIGGDANFRGARFGQAANFEAIRIDGNAAFGLNERGVSVHFGGPVTFSLANIKGVAFFEKTKFIGPAHFVRTHCEREALFLGTSFVRDASFNGATVGGNLVLSPDATNSPINFGGLVSFEMANLKGNFLLLGVEIKSKANFFAMKVSGNILVAPDELGNPCRFYDLVNFERTTIEGGVKFNKAEFQERASFINARIASSAVFVGTRFNKDAKFGRLYVAGGIIFETDDDSRPVYFGGELDFTDAHIEGEATFMSAQFMKAASFDRARIEGAAFFRADEHGQAVHFNDVASFAGAYIRGQVGFDRAVFGNSAIFLNAHFEAEASFRGARFVKDASFDRAQIGIAYFRPDESGNPVCFSGEVRFHGSHIYGDATFTSVKFEREAGFESTQVDGNVFFCPDELSPNTLTLFHEMVKFNNVRILGSADFRGVQFLKEVRFDNAYFRGIASFYFAPNNGQSLPVRFIGSAFFSAAVFDSATIFSNAEFSESVRFDGTHFKLSVSFSDAHFKNEVVFGATIVDRNAHFEQAVFVNRVSFREARFQSVFFREDKQGLPNKREAQFLGTVDLRGFTYERMSINWQDLFAQLYPYDRQPYEFFEKTMRLSGQDREADSIYLHRRKRENKQRWERIRGKANAEKLSFSSTIVEVFRALFDGFQRLLFGYGVRAYRLLFISLAVILIGAYMFSQPDAVKLKDKQVQIMNLQANNLPGNSQGEEPVHLSLGQAFGVSLRLFIPVVEIPSGSLWIPSEKPAPLLRRINLSFAGYATLHRLAGALLVPLGIAAVTGLLYRRKRE
jgi:uncharacterized protein YjbI with pentapeptide repeats